MAPAGQGRVRQGAIVRTGDLDVKHGLTGPEQDETPLPVGWGVLSGSRSRLHVGRGTLTRLERGRAVSRAVHLSRLVPRPEGGRESEGPYAPICLVGDVDRRLGGGTAERYVAVFAEGRCRGAMAAGGTMSG